MLVKPVETQETLNGGRILLTDAVREHWTIGQAEVVAVGEPAICDEEWCERDHIGLHPVSNGNGDGSYLRAHVAEPRLQPGAWILCKPRRQVEMPDGTWMVTQDDIVGVWQ